MQCLLSETPDKFDRMLVNYDPCRGNPEFLQSLADFFNRQYGWNLTTNNIVVTNGGQTAFFYLINLLAGEVNGRCRKILLPLVPEYIGYANQGIGRDTFRAVKPEIERDGDVSFKYRVNFGALEVTNDVAAICVSRPTNPTGNVLTDDEIHRLRSLALENQIPLIVDNAYGAPFPNIIFGDVTPPWGENVVLTYSLSKLGLPGTRTGIVIGPPQITQAISSINAIAGLANGNVGQVLVTDLLNNDRLAHMCRDIVRPFYQRKSEEALNMLMEMMPAGRFRVHVSEGALFLWLRLKMPITSAELYERLKRRGVLVVPGEYFFFGLEESWPHQHECIRMTFSMPTDVVRGGIEILADELRNLN
jgi:valine--pyruvate aminotransferase